MPGIWYMPFAGTYNDPCFAARQTGSSNIPTASPMTFSGPAPAWT